MLNKICFWVNTARHLKIIQLYWRIRLEFSRLFLFPGDLDRSVVTRKITLAPVIEKGDSFKNNFFSFINEIRSFNDSPNWHSAEVSKLWLYNLHYFDYLNQSHLKPDQGLIFCKDWIENNLPTNGDGWEPYPTSLRLVNWVKFFTKYPFVDKSGMIEINQSLFIQSRFLYRNLEFHLLGNHLFKNGVAMVFAGAYFEGSEARCWLKKGKAIILKQLGEQILPDGGHFERSPMYHAIILDDILDCVNLGLAIEIFSEPELKQLKKKAKKMLEFLTNIVHPDGEISFFNDCAFKIAPKLIQLKEYAKGLGIHDRSLDVSIQKNKNVIIQNPSSGYYIFENDHSKFILDAAPIGPDFLPGHAHCDTLSYELSINGLRCIVNSGTFQYAGKYRNSFRATGAHNTVQINDEEQHEIWSTFRVARRGYPFDIRISSELDEVIFSAAHSGFKRLAGHPIHRRTIYFRDKSIFIRESIEGKGMHYAKSFIHLHPSVEITEHSSNLVTCNIGDTPFSLYTEQGNTITIEKGWFSPEFGIKQENTVLVLEKKDETPYHFGYGINY